MTKKVDALGFDRMEIANIKRCYAANKTNYKKLDAIKEKIIALGEAMNGIQALIDSWEGPAKSLSKEKLGVELSSREILEGHLDPETFFVNHPELNSHASENSEDVVTEFEEPETSDEVEEEMPF